MTRVPLRRSLVVRLLATSVLIALAAIAATAWLAVQSTSRAIRQEQGRSLADDKSVYDMLIGYAATHRDWTGVQPLIDARAAKIDRRITLLTDDREVIADSAKGEPPTAARASATVDPLHLDQGLTGGAERIDARVAGPYRLPEAEHAKLRLAAEKDLQCLTGTGGEGQLVDTSAGRPVVQVLTPSPGGVAAQCTGQSRIVTPTEERALRALAGLTQRCLGLNGREEMVISRTTRSRLRTWSGPGGCRRSSPAWPRPGCSNCVRTCRRPRCCS
ncbi:hypothetical protein [Actinoplanes sp. TFC3]|uniref:hypothetical protein n=1 Tax=Actinoplanes sp. TFC3 TaxID=1710355 RepID=UPI000A87DC0C|nr:hypothetical protein [Actinoplanes sp. TFC3]